MIYVYHILNKNTQGSSHIEIYVGEKNFLFCLDLCSPILPASAREKRGNSLFLCFIVRKGINPIIGDKLTHVK